VSGVGALRVARSGSPSADRLQRRLAERGRRVLDRATVRAAESIVEDVRRRGDAALLDAVARHDGVRMASVSELRHRNRCDREPIDPRFRDAVEAAIAAVESYHSAQVRSSTTRRRAGVCLEERRLPLRRVGLYVPGGRAVYPSTVVMSVVPARVAGVSEIVVATPPAALAASPELRWTLARLQVREVWGMGGAHAIAALAYGTETIARVDKILGPGNAFVSAAKRAVDGVVAIDGLAGPSEVVIVAGTGEDAATVASDLLAQAEHDPRAAAVLVTDGAAFASAVAREVASQLAELSTAATARASLAAFGGAFVVADANEALALVEAIAPEHLQLVGAWAERLHADVRNAGAVFVGGATPEVFGDYLAGPSHVLPTCGTARFASVLGVEDFIRRSHVVRFDAAAARRAAPLAAAFAEVEGLPAHAAAARRRA
jgi:histidinol dehydrogenase